MNKVHFHLLEHVVTSQSDPPWQVKLTALQKSNSVTQTILSERTKRTERISKIIKSIKGISAREANKLLEKKGSFWQTESYDHIVRDETELGKIIKYVIYNPVKAKLIEKWADWEFTYLTNEW